MPDAFADIYAELRALMLREATGMRAVKDVPGELVMLAPWPHPRKPEAPMSFGMVRSGKAYVSFHLMPLYMNPAMQARVPAGLIRRKQGKTCFNFKQAEPALLAELAVLTRVCAEAWASPMTLPDPAGRAMRHALTPHSSRPGAIAGVEVEASRPGPGLLALRYVVADPERTLRLPRKAAPARADGLWRRTCFEAFVQVPGSEAYYELNLSPSMRWAAYRFDGYRAGMAPALNIGAPVIETATAGAGFELWATLDLSAVGDLPPQAPWRLGLSAVIEDRERRISHWALAHPPGKADFHHAAGFAAELSA